jgi:hypothetical protein
VVLRGNGLFGGAVVWVGLLAWLVCAGGCLVFSAFGAGVGVVALEGTWV